MKNVNKLDFTGATQYQAIYDKQGNLLRKGWRTTQRCDLIAWHRLRSKSVLDLGCNNGMMSIRAKWAGASKVVGVDFGDHISFARRLVKHFDLDIEFWHMDLRSDEFLNLCPEFDFIFCFSVFRYMPEKERFLAFLDRCTRDTLWLETNHKDPAEPTYEMLQKSTSFDGVQILGQSEGNPDNKGHWMIRCRKAMQWRIVPVTFMPLSKIQITHDLEGFKDEERWGYAPGSYETKKQEVELLMADIEKYGLRTPIWVREILGGPFAGKYRVIEGHRRTLSLIELNRNEKKIYDVPCRILPQAHVNWLRNHGNKEKDLKGQNNE